MNLCKTSLKVQEEEGDEKETSTNRKYPFKFSMGKDALLRIMNKRSSLRKLYIED